MRLGDTIFLHGGISPQLPEVTLDQLNDRIKNEIRTFDDFRSYFVKQKLILPFFTLEEMTRAIWAEVDARKAGFTELSAREGKTTEAIEKEKWHLKLLEDFLSYPAWLSVHPDGPLWFRGFAESPEGEGAPRDRKSTRLNSSHIQKSRMPSSA